MASRTPIQALISADAIPSSEADERFGPFRKLAARILGQAPTCSSAFHSSPLTTTFYFACFRSLLHIPHVDLRLSALTPENRRQTMFASSRAHGCAYCIGHCCAIGDVVAGAFPAQCDATGVARPYARPVSESGESELQALVAQVCAVPARVTREAKQAFVDKFSEEAFDDLIDILAYAAWLNFVMDALDMQLEDDMVSFADDAMADVAAASSRVTAGAELKKGLDVGFGGWIRGAATLVTFVPAILSASVREATWYWGIPSDPRGLDTWVSDLLGILPQFVEDACTLPAKRALALGLREIFAKTESTVWTVRERAAFMYVFGRRIENATLAEDGLHLWAAQGGGKLWHGEDAGDDPVVDYNGEGKAAAGVEEGKARRVLEVVFEGAKSPDTAQDRFMAATRFIYGCAARAGGVSETVQRELVQWVDVSKDVVDLVGMVGFFACAHRVQVLSTL